jgi:molybdopterin/thiamine biosynthesis adenylyltransferase
MRFKLPKILSGRFQPRRVVLVGAGGVGTHLAEPLYRTLWHSDKSNYYLLPFVIIDGDDFEEGNESRQRHSEIGESKAEVMVESLKKCFMYGLDIHAIDDYISEKNIGVLIKDGDIVLSCVDNHRTRKLLSDRISTLKNAALISGGNDLTTGNTQVFVRSRGKNITPPLTHLHPEIEFPEDENPADRVGCIIQAQSSPQILAANMMVATLMLSAFWNILDWLDQEKKRFGFTEQYFDIETGSVKPYNRNK